MEKLPPHAPESTIAGTAGQAGSSPAPGKCCCGCALTHSTNSNHSAPLAFLAGEARGDSGIESTGTKRATNLEHKTRNGDFLGAIRCHCPKAAAGCGALLPTQPFCWSHGWVLAAALMDVDVLRLLPAHTSLATEAAAQPLLNCWPTLQPGALAQLLPHFPRPVEQGSHAWHGSSLGTGKESGQ